MIRRIAALALGLFHYTVSLWAAEVLGVARNRKSIAIKHDASSLWVVDDRVCVQQARVDVVCGTVIKTTSKGAIVNLDTVYDAVAIGDPVRRAADRRLSTQSVDGVYAWKSSNAPRWNLTVGLGAGGTLKFFYPQLHFQYALGKSLALGIEPFYLRNKMAGLMVQTVGGFMTLSYYSQSPFRGLWVQVAGGAAYLSASALAFSFSQTTFAPAGLATLGYRLRWSGGVNAGLAGGALYIQEPSFVKMSYTGVNGLLQVDFGLSF